MKLNLGCTQYLCLDMECVHCVTVTAVMVATSHVYLVVAIYYTIRIRWLYSGCLSLYWKVCIYNTVRNVYMLCTIY